MCGVNPEPEGALIRRAEPADVPVLYAMLLCLAENLGASAGVAATEDDWRRDGFGVAPRFLTLVAETDGQIVGMATFTELYFPDLGKPTYYVLQLYVEPGYRRRGIGRALLQHVAIEAKARGIPVILVGAARQHRSQNIYTQNGYVEADRYFTYFLFGERLENSAAAVTATA